jgi:hypothetical protein
MPKNIVFHIGFPKTATTYLQKYIFPQIKKDNWIVIDPFFNNTNHYQEFRKDPAYFNQKQFENKNIFLSSEYLSDPFRDFNYNKAYLEMLDKIYEYPIFIIVTREDIINSLYLQTIKRGSSIPASRFLKERKILNLDTTNFSELPHLCDLVLDFEELKSEPNTFLSRLKTFIDFDFEYVNKKDTNTSFGILSTRISLILNPFFRSMNNPHGLIPLPYRHTHLFTYLRRFKWYRKIDKKKNYFKEINNYE